MQPWRARAVLAAALIHISAAAIVERSAKRCAKLRAWIGEDRHLTLPGLRPMGLLVGDDGASDTAATTSALYCAEPAADFALTRMRRLSAALAHGQGRAAARRHGLVASCASHQ